MKYLITLTLLLFFLSSFTYSQEVKVEYMSPVFTQYGPDWSTDRLVSNTEPFGKLTGAAKSNGTIYLAVPDTNIVSNRCIIVYRSTNFGNNWSTFASVQPAAIIPRTKMVRSGLDSVYLF